MEISSVVFCATFLYSVGSDILLECITFIFLFVDWSIICALETVELFTLAYKLEKLISKLYCYYTTAVLAHAAKENTHI